MAKNKNLIKVPFSWENRKPTLYKGVLFIPDYFFEHEKYSSDLENIIQDNKVTNIEYCSGNGDWAIERATADKNVNWILVEKRIDRINKIYKKRSSNNLDTESNMLIVSGDAKIFAKEYVKDSKIDNIYINFPDPWPKDRHAKHRLNSIDFLTSVLRSLKVGGMLCITSDDKEFLDTAKFNLTSISSDLSVKIEALPREFGASYFRTLWESKGRELKMLTAKKTR